MSIQLTPREQQAVELMRQGLTNRKIADEMVVALGTVKMFLQAAKSKGVDWPIRSKTAKPRLWHRAWDLGSIPAELFEAEARRRGL